MQKVMQRLGKGWAKTVLGLFRVEQGMTT
jgi:hypothetical protein